MPSGPSRRCCPDEPARLSRLGRLAQVTSGLVQGPAEPDCCGRNLADPQQHGAERHTLPATHDDRSALMAEVTIYHNPH